MKRSNYPVQSIHTVASPSLLFFRDHIERNIAAMIDIAGGTQRLRPHVKTFKSIDVVNLLHTRGIDKFKCSTIAEAEMLAQAGFSDLFLAYPIVGPNIDRLISLLGLYPELDLKVLGDDETAVAELSRRLESAGGRSRVQVMVDIDPGLHRTGVAATEVPRLAKFIDRAAGIEFGGLHYYDGNNRQFNFDDRMAAAAEGYQTVSGLVDHLRGEGITTPRIVMGGTPTFPCYARYPEVELSPGTSVLHDWGYSKNFPDLPFTPAALVLGRVVSRPTDGRFTVDIGSKAIASDPAGPRGIILGWEQNESLFQNEEHWVWADSSGNAPQVGTEVLVIPTHICPTTALYDEALIVGPDGRIEDTWPITARSRRLSV